MSSRAGEVGHGQTLTSKETGVTETMLRVMMLTYVKFITTGLFISKKQS